MAWLRWFYSSFIQVQESIVISAQYGFHICCRLTPECCGPSRLQPSKVFPTSCPCCGHSTGYQVAARIHFNVLTLAYAAANKTAPPHLQDIIQAYTPAPPLRSAATGRLAQPASRATVSRSSRLLSFSTLAPQWWNDLPIPIRTAPSLPSGGTTSPSP